MSKDVWVRIPPGAPIYIIGELVMDTLYICNKKNPECPGLLSGRCKTSGCIYTLDKRYSKTLLEGKEPVFKKYPYPNYKGEEFQVEVSSDFDI